MRASTGSMRAAETDSRAQGHTGLPRSRRQGSPSRDAGVATRWAVLRRGLCQLASASCRRRDGLRAEEPALLLSLLLLLAIQRRVQPFTWPLALMGRADATAAFGLGAGARRIPLWAAGGASAAGAVGGCGRHGRAARPGKAQDSLGLAQGLRLSGGVGPLRPCLVPPRRKAAPAVLQVAHAGEHAGSSSTTAPPRSPSRGPRWHHPEWRSAGPRRPVRGRSASRVGHTTTRPEAPHGAPRPLPGRGARPRADALGPAGSLARHGAAPDGAGVVANEEAMPRPRHRRRRRLAGDERCPASSTSVATPRPEAIPPDSQSGRGLDDVGERLRRAQHRRRAPRARPCPPGGTGARAPSLLAGANLTESAPMGVASLVHGGAGCVAETARCNWLRRAPPPRPPPARKARHRPRRPGRRAWTLLSARSELSASSAARPSTTCTWARPWRAPQCSRHGGDAPSRARRSSSQRPWKGGKSRSAPRRLPKSR